MAAEPIGGLKEAFIGNVCCKSSPGLKTDDIASGCRRRRRLGSGPNIQIILASVAPPNCSLVGDDEEMDFGGASEAGG